MIRMLVLCLLVALLAGSGAVTWEAWIGAGDFRMSGCVAACTIAVEFEVGWGARVWVDARVVAMARRRVLEGA